MSNRMFLNKAYAGYVENEIGTFIPVTCTRVSADHPSSIKVHVGKIYSARVANDHELVSMDDNGSSFSLLVEDGFLPVGWNVCQNVSFLQTAKNKTRNRIKEIAVSHENVTNTSFEECVNEWFDENPDIRIISISYQLTETMSGAIIHYEQ